MKFKDARLFVFGVAALAACTSAQVHSKSGKHLGGKLTKDSALLQVEAVLERTRVTYVPSQFEDYWTATASKGKIVEKARAQLETGEEWTAYTESVFSPNRKPYRKPSESVINMMSRFKHHIGSETQWGTMIEPLTGVGRHPLFIRKEGGAQKVNARKWWQFWKPKKSRVLETNEGRLFDIRYLFLENKCTLSPEEKSEDYVHFPQREYTEAKMFDLGCTVYQANGVPLTGTTKMDITSSGSGSAAGPSIPLFYNMYKERCLEFDHIWAWEGIKFDPEDWWAPVPTELRHKLHFINTYINELSIEDSVDGIKEAPLDSFLRLLPLAAKESDFVVLKVDIDGGPEMEIVQAIAARPELYRLVDEMFFEYHYNYDNVENFGWGEEKPVGSIEIGSSVDTAMELMQKLRSRGIRAHFWI